MKSLLAILAIALLTNTSFAQETVFDLPPSKNALVNFSIDFLKNNPQYEEFTKFEFEFARQVRNVKNKSALFASLNRGLLQISEETLAAKQVYLNTKSYENYVLSMSLGSEFNLVTAVQDERFRNMVLSGLQNQGVLGLALSQVHALSEKEFAVFAAEFIKTLKTTQNILAQTNQVAEEAFVRDEVANKSDLLEQVSKERVAEFLESLKKSAQKRFAESYKANITSGAYLLYQLLQAPVSKENRALSIATLQRQRMRILSLMISALKDKTVFTIQQQEKIVQTLKHSSAEELAKLPKSKYSEILKGLYSSEEVQKATEELKALPKSCARSLLN